jgi:hypothetical protein
MVTQVRSTAGVVIWAVAITLALGIPGSAFAADKEKKPTKKPGASQSTKVPAPKGTGKKYETAEAAGKATACFGNAPKIEQVTPDEGRAGDTVTIHGSSFGPVECLRGVSFGPGHTATFKLQDGGKIIATVPGGGRKGLAILTVTTASGEDSKPFLVK